jgi:hypothetical protein
LQREGCSDGSIASVGIGLTAGLVILKEDLADLAVGEVADRGRISKSADLELKRLASAALGSRR